MKARLRGTTKPTDIPPDAELVARAKAGDAYAFGLLYETYFAQIYRYAYFRVSDQQTAEDIASQVFLKAWESLDRYRISEAPILAWLYTIARNEVIASYRKGKVTVNLEELELASTARRPEEQVEVNLQTQAARRALQRLTEDQRQVLILKFIEGFSTHETAIQMGKQEGAIRALQMRALQALAIQMEGEEAE